MKPRILWCSETPLATTGYGVTTKELCGRLALMGTKFDAFELGVHAWYHHPAAKLTGLPYKLFPVAATEKEFKETIKDRNGKMGAFNFDEVVAKFKPDIVIANSDAWMQRYIADSKLRDAFTYIAYLPIDGIPLSKDIKQVIRNADMTVAMTKFGEAVVTEECPGIRAETIYLGVDTNAFRKLPERDALKASYSSSGDLSGMFVVQVVARNQPRKMLPRAVLGFNKFAADKNDVALYMHCAEEDAGWPIKELVASINPDLKVITSADLNATAGFSVNKYVATLNIADVGLLPTGGEGFGIPVLEWMACEVPVVGTNYAATSELLANGRGELIEVKDYIVEPHSCVRRAVCSVDSICNSLNKLYHNPMLRQRLGRKGREFALANDWLRSAEMWYSLIQRVQSAGKPATNFFTDPMRPVKLEAF